MAPNIGAQMAQAVALPRSAPPDALIAPQGPLDGAQQQHQRSAMPAQPPAAASPSASMTEVPPPRKRGRKPHNRVQQECKSCGTTSTPEWRKGPDGRNSLCNACGLRWSKAVRPDGLRPKSEADGARGDAGSGSSSGGTVDAPAAGAHQAASAAALAASQEPSLILSHQHLPAPPAAAAAPPAAGSAVPPHFGGPHEHQPLALGTVLEDDRPQPLAQTLHAHPIHPNANPHHQLPHPLHEELRSEDHLLGHNGEEATDGDKTMSAHV